jgi:hypothetical protein
MRKQAGRSARFKRKALARWRWLAARGIELEASAAEIGLGADNCAPERVTPASRVRLAIR